MKKKSLIFIFLIILAIIILLVKNHPFFTNIPKNNDYEYKSNSISIPKKSEAQLTLVGDFLYEKPYYDSLKEGDSISSYFSKVKKYFDHDDLSIGNMEVVIGDDTMEVSGSNYSFCAPQNVGYEVVNLDMEVLGLANNHANDRGIAGRKSTVKFFKENSDILTVGTYESKDKDVSSNVLEINGIKFGFLAYTMGTNKIITFDERYSLGLFRDPDTNQITDEYKDEISKDINYLRQRVDCLIVLVHWGNEYTYDTNKDQNEMAKLFNDLGVDIVVGAHSHNMQNIQWYNTDKHKTLIFYSLGNFVSADYLVSRTNDEFRKSYQIGLMSKLKVSKNQDKIEISDIKTEPIINYYDNNIRNFMLIPYNEYDEIYEKTHYMYKNGFNKEFIESTYDKVISKEFRNRINEA